MKRIILLLISLLMISCNCNKKSGTTLEEKQIITENIDENEEILLGKITCKNLEKGIYNEWFLENFNAHQLDTETLNDVKTLIKNTSIKIFMGTWCEDSQREVPAFHKITETLGISENNYEIIALSRDKDSPEGLEKGFEIEYVPTIIFHANGKEIGRIVESPVESLEKDMLTILSGKEYKHTYQE